METPCCSHECVLVEKCMGDADDRNDALEGASDEIKKSLCYTAIQDEDQYGHLNYAVSAYAATQGHLACLKYIHRVLGCMWHGGLAQVAYEEGQSECLAYILSDMGDVDPVEP